MGGLCVWVGRARSVKTEEGFREGRADRQLSIQQRKRVRVGKTSFAPPSHHHDNPLPRSNETTAASSCEKRREAKRRGDTTGE